MDNDEPKVTTRRRFLIASGVAAAAGAGALTWADLARRAPHHPGVPNGSSTDRILVVVTLYGGNDGLNTVVPLRDAAYHDSRPELAVAADQTLALDADHGLNPALKGVKKLWDAGRVAIVHGVGYPKPDHSHFRSMDIWQTASPAEPVRTGWIGRWLDTLPPDPVRVVNMGGVLPPLIVGAHTAGSSLALGRQRSLPAAVANGLTALGQSDSADSAAAALVRQSYRSERTVSAAYAPVLSTATTGAAGQGSLQDQLAVTARAINLGVPTSLYSVGLGGFDTHAGERSTHQQLLAAFDAAVSSFFTAVDGGPRGREVVLLAYSEFGRRVRANAAQGTDHGTAGPVFVIGSGVRPGLHGQAPSLTDLDAGDLRYTTDFRAVYGELLEKVLRSDSRPVLGKPFDQLGILT